jgi:hypothetical protein
MPKSVNRSLKKVGFIIPDFILDSNLAQTFNRNEII